ncbi:MAG: hypothetical protein Q9175_007156 [Cornicularia normoerica]
MSYNPIYEASRALPVEHIAKELEDFAAAGQDLSGRRFSRSPPRVPSVPSTTYEESEPPSPTEQLQDKESLELDNSTAGAQFNIQVRNELGRIRTARDKDLLQHPSLLDLEEAAEANVKYRWIQQGIWDERWESQPSKIWKHELQDPPSPVRPSDSVKEGGVTELKAKHKRKRSELEEECHEISRRAVDYQNQQSSRPCYQFVYQFCQERQWIKMGLSNGDQDQQTNLDTRAYETLKSRWIRDGIWDDDWTFVPGTSWRHERPRKTLDPQERYRREDARKAARIEQAERPPHWYSMAPIPPLTRIYWPSTRPVSLEAFSDPDPSGLSILELSSKVKPSPRNRSRTSRRHTHPGCSGFESTAKSKPDSKSQEHDEPRTKSATKKTTVPPTRTDPKKKTPQKQKIDTSQSCIAVSRPVKKQTSANKEKNGPPRPVVRPIETAKDTTASRPRRAAALKAMKNLRRAT